MRVTRSVALVLFLLSTLTIDVNSQAENARTDSPSVALMQQVLDAWSSLDPTQPRRFYSQESGWVFYDVTPGKMQFVGFDQYVHSLDGMASQYAHFHMKLRGDAKTHVMGKLAWGTGTWEGVATRKHGQTEKIAARWTVIWQRESKGWLIVHEHVSVPTPQ
jgi:ketosteroid isomerase-like protein